MNYGWAVNGESARSALGPPFLLPGYGSVTLGVLQCRQRTECVAIRRRKYRTVSRKVTGGRVRRQEVADVQQLHLLQSVSTVIDSLYFTKQGFQTDNQ